MSDSTISDDPFNLSRFVHAQEGQYLDALEELRAGRKQTHWIWFVFPQHRALGRSDIARLYGLQSIEEAVAYWQHPTLGPRLRECVQAMLDLEGKSAAEVLGEIDALKFRSCATLFAAAAPLEPRFQAALERYYQGRPDSLTLELLRGDAE